MALSETSVMPAERPGEDWRLWVGGVEICGVGGVDFAAIEVLLKVGTAFGRGWRDGGGRRADCAIVPCVPLEGAFCGDSRLSHRTSHSSLHVLEKRFPTRRLSPEEAALRRC